MIHDPARDGAAASGAESRAGVEHGGGVRRSGRRAAATAPSRPLPVASRTAGTTFCAAKPPRLPIELIAASPALPKALLLRVPPVNAVTCAVPGACIAAA